MRTPLDTTPQRALVHLLNGNVDAARAIFFSGFRHRQLVSDSLQLAAENPRSMQSKFVRKHVGAKRLKFLSDHLAIYASSANCDCDRQLTRPASRMKR